MNFREQLKLFRLAHFARAASIKIELVWLLCTWKSVFPRWRNWKSLRFLTLVLLLLGISLRFSPLYTKQKKRFFQSRLQQLDSQSINQFTSLFSGHCHHSIFFLSYFLSLPLNHNCWKSFSCVWFVFFFVDCQRQKIITLPLLTKIVWFPTERFSSQLTTELLSEKFNFLLFSEHFSLRKIIRKIFVSVFLFSYVSWSC